jgi:uncharacterized membrane protein
VSGGDENEDRLAAQRRLRGFGYHLVGYFVVMIVLVAVNFALTPGRPWFVLPMVGWGAVLAIHAAYAMGLFGVFRRR